MDYQDGLCGDFNVVVSGYVDGYFNNTCIQGQNVPYVIFDYNLDQIQPDLMPTMNDNKIYNSARTLTVNCGGSVISEDRFQQMGYDLGTQVFPMPSNDDIMKWGRQLLNF